MPELPEVETIRRDLETLVTGRRITGITIAPETGKPVPVLKGTDEATFREGVVGARIDNGHEIRFTDMRKFGGFWLLDDFTEASKGGLGPEPLSDEFTVDVLAAALANRKAPVKSILLDQKYIAGIGNIYADEACYGACIDPRRLGADVKPSEVARLHGAIKDVLVFGVESRGTSFRDYKDVAGQEGSMHMHVKVFRRTGKPCYTCGTPIERVKLGGRSTHFCPKCQT